MYTLTFKIEGRPHDIKCQVEAGENVLRAAERMGIEMDAPCAGNGTCGKCRIRLISGALEMPQNPRLPYADYEEMWRLACQSTVVGDAVVWVPASASAFKQDIATADLSTPEELARYESAIEAIFSTGLSKTPFTEGCGIAVDIGTTTVTAALLDLATGKVLSKASRGNGQIRFGADVINRIIQQMRPGGKERLQRAVREETIIPIMESLFRDSGKTSADISRIVIAGNTTMEHLFIGADGDSIRLEPYVPAFLELTGIDAEKAGLPAPPDSPVIFAPNVGSYVGGDITAGVLDTLMWDSDLMTLFIDLGTNGELVLGNREYMLTCACSAGPAFEGGDISCGMRATTGAIDSVRIDEETLEPQYTLIAGEKPAGLCGSGLIDIISELFRTGAVNSKGKFVRESRRIRYDEFGGNYIVAFADESATGSDIELNEGDLDNFIRAKAAIFSAIRTMLGSLAMTPDDIDRVIIAGGIGSGIDIEKAISIGMLPLLPLDRYSYIGNSSLTGACAMLLSDEATDKVFEIGRNMTYIELSTEPGYMDEFLAACFLPHTDHRLFEKPEEG
ncbi:MAG: DUF4445 domain-containing protein [Oscillospiraceae bacterium]|nr:DUF4445 domain-containing protein [Oscillospiraceae bacterium]